MAEEAFANEYEEVEAIGREMSLYTVYTIPDFYGCWRRVAPVGRSMACEHHSLGGVIDGLLWSHFPDLAIPKTVESQTPSLMRAYAEWQMNQRPTGEPIPKTIFPTAVHPDCHPAPKAQRSLAKGKPICVRHREMKKHADGLRRLLAATLRL